MATSALLQVNIRPERFDLEENSPSILQFKTLPSSTHCQIWGTELEIRTQIIRNSIELSEQQFFEYDKDKIDSIISTLLPSPIELDPKVRRLAISRIIWKTLEILELNSSSRNKKWVMNIEIKIVTHYNMEDKEGEKEEEEEDPVGEAIASNFVPASLTSIEGLEKRRLVDNGFCTICMEKLPIGCFVTCMPCSHVFHNQCLVQWLRRSCLCPCCRLQLPPPAILISSA